MMRFGLADPLGTVKACSAIVQELEQRGLAVEASSDFVALAAARLEARQSKLSPYFDPAVTELTTDRFLWVKASAENGTIMALQAFRLDEVTTSLADWGISYFIGVYMRRQEMMIPSHPSPPRGSIAHRLRGRLVYHGELWVSPQLKNRRLFERVSRLGLLLSLIKWNPDAMWGLTSHQMAAHGHVGRIGYAHLEPGFQRWLWKSEGIDPIEYLAVAERTTLERLVTDELATKPELLLDTPRSRF